MKKKGLILATALLLCVCTIAGASSIDIQQLTYEELTLLRSEIDARMEVLMREYALENGNRKITLDQTELLLFQKEKISIGTEVERIVEDAPEETVLVWTSSNPEVATVSEKGQVSAVAEGEAVITCSAQDDEYIFASVPVRVVLRVEDITLEPLEGVILRLSDKDVSLKQQQLTPTFEPENAYWKEVEWKSSDEKVAVVNQNGVVTAVAPGSATITAFSTEKIPQNRDIRKGMRKVTVVQDVNNIELESNDLRVQKDKRVTLKANVFPENASKTSLSWESSNEEIATVSSSGQITGKSCGTCTITCRATDESGVSAVCTITVYQPVSSLTLSEKNINAYIGMEPFALSAMVSPDDATEKTLVWTSTDPTVASVDEQGNVTAVGGGSCEIVCSTTDGSEKEAKVSVRVPSISVAQEAYTVTKKSGLTIPVQYYGKDIQSLKISVASTKTLAAELVIEQTGAAIHVTPQKYGETYITLKDGADDSEGVKLTISIEHSAVYDSTSYPKAEYKEILRYPKDHEGKTYQIYGRVLQKLNSGSTVALRVGTTGSYYDSVYYIMYNEDTLNVRVIEDDFVTVYGICQGTYTYETVMGAEVTIPFMIGEKIDIGRK